MSSEVIMLNDGLLKEIKCIEDTLTNVLDVSIKIEENNKIVNEISY